MKKKLWMLVSVCLLAMCLGACTKTDPTTVDYNGMTYSDLEQGSQAIAQNLISVTDEQIEDYLTQNAEKDDPIAYAQIKSFKEAKVDEGSFVKLGEFTPSLTNDTLTLNQEIVYENRSIMMTAVFDSDSMETQGITFDKVYSLGEKMSKAGMNTLMGIGTVFVILILISIIIYAFRIIPYLTEKKNKKTAPAVNDVVEQIAIREEQLQDDVELVAVISAAIAAATGNSTDGFVVRSIKRR